MFDIKFACCPKLFFLPLPYDISLAGCVTAKMLELIVFSKIQLNGDFIQINQNSLVKFANTSIKCRLIKLS